MLLALIASVTQTSSLLIEKSKSFTGRMILIGFIMSNIYNSKERNQNKLLSNIRLFKIIAIILGLLITVGLVILFMGLANSFKNLDKSKVVELEIKEKELTIFNFSQPLDAQLISSSLGTNNQILLRYIYKGKNVLVILDTKSKKMTTLITIKKELQSW